MLGGISLTIWNDMDFLVSFTAELNPATLKKHAKQIVGYNF